ncbi:MAG: cytochrome Caa3 oxidase [Thermobacillus sp. ZCTH02-B1]|uniref:COX15/CtaA family protein n=1 Tax=Thermobacillus sp. ZCTH02-B1 TaxID=1858795 RepID=UPI000B577BD8|nr:COX15/CtaA family protein [Thermobacillus sp. ZCTH02-B1]OUM95278.1 MAG: cytochrome Caa3 oxidase [Thermobacillus sp. ZCTH02-B1]
MISGGYRKLAVATCVGMLIVLLGGALVTNTGSGDGCGTDWPLCHGKFIPARTLESAIEYSHRFFTGIVGILVIAIVVATWRLVRRMDRPDPEPLWYAGSIFVFTVVQSLMGAAAVKWPQSSQVMALHFGISLFAFAGTMLLVLWVLRRGRAAERGMPSIPRGVFPFALAVSVYSLIVIYLGAYIRHTDSSGGCGTDWPLCAGALVPELEGATLIAFVHRLAAALFLVLAILLHAYVRRRADRGTARIASWILGMTCGQVLSGALVTWTVGNDEVFIFTSLLHNLVICGLFSLLADLTIQSGIRRAAGGRRN